MRLIYFIGSGEPDFLVFVCLKMPFKSGLFTIISVTICKYKVNHVEQNFLNITYTVIMLISHSTMHTSWETTLNIRKIMWHTPINPSIPTTIYCPNGPKLYVSRTKNSTPTNINTVLCITIIWMVWHQRFIHMQRCKVTKSHPLLSKNRNKELSHSFKTPNCSSVECLQQNCCNMPKVHVFVWHRM